MRPRGWVWSLLAAGLVLCSAPPTSAAVSRYGGTLSLRYRSGGFSAGLHLGASYYRGGGYYSGWYGPYYPPRIYPPNYYGGYFSVYPAFGYGYPHDDFPIYDFPVYAGLPLVPVGFLNPNWPGWYAPVYLWPRLYFGNLAVSPPATRVVELPPRVQEAPAPSEAPPKPGQREARPETPAKPEEREAPPGARLAPVAPPAGAGEGNKAHSAGPSAQHRTVRLGRLQVDWGDGARTQVLWTGDPRVIGELRVEELDGARERLTDRRIDAYPFRASFERDPKTLFLRVTAFAGEETLATALFRREP
jgi:hypothetical protein